MLQVIEGLFSRLSAWIAADPQHGEIWLGVGLTLTIGCIGLLSFEQIKARTVEQG